MLETIKSYINGIPDIPFEDYYQNYICEVQDRNIESEIEFVQSDDILTMSALLTRLHKELFGK